MSCRDRVVESQAAFFLRMFCQVASQLKEEAKAWQGHIMATGLWQQVCQMGSGCWVVCKV